MQSTVLVSFAALLALAGATSMRGATASAPHASSLAPTGSTAEWFAIEEPPSPVGASAGHDTSGTPRVAGVARFSTLTRGRTRVLESELLFAREGGLGGVVRVLAVEELGADGASSSWREIESAGGRSLHAEWRRDDDALQITEWGNGPTWREELGSDEGALLPHYLLELLRRGRMTSGSVPCFDPLSRSIERLEVATAYERDEERDASTVASSGSGGAGTARTVELVRVDGTLARRYRFEGTRLLGFQLQEGGAWARAVGEEEFERTRRALLDAAERQAESPAARAARAVEVDATRER